MLLTDTIELLCHEEDAKGSPKLSSKKHPSLENPLERFEKRIGLL